MPTPVILDCDPGHDDAIALLLLLASPEVQLLGVTTVAGNASLADTTSNALRVLEIAGRTDLVVAAGADRPLIRTPRTAEHVHGAGGLAGPELRTLTTRPSPQHAIDFIADRISAEPDPVTLIAVGPLTNVALFLVRYPGLAERLDRLVLMGGAIGLGNTTPAAEFNIWGDPEAASRVFESGLDVTMVGLDVTLRALLGPSHLEGLRNSGQCGRFVSQLLEFSMDRYQRIYGFEGAPIHDAVAAAHVVKPGLLATGKFHVAVDTESELCRGRTVVDRWGVTGKEANAWVGEEIDAPTFAEMLVERISSLP